MSSISGFPSQSHLLFKSDNAQPAPVDEPREDDSPAAVVQRFVENSDEMSAVLRSQFRRRGDFGSRFEGQAESFERVLAEELIPNVTKIQALVAQSERSIEWLLQQARALFPDDSDLVLVLRELLRRKELPQAARQRLENLLQQVVDQAPAKRLKAGINCALKAKMFGKALNLRATLMRDTYRSFLETDGSAVESYEDWISIYGYKHRGSVLQFIEMALLTDIDSLDPSCSREEFGQLLSRLAMLKRLRSADNTFMQRVLQVGVIKQHNSNEPDWLVFLLGLLQYPDDLESMLEGVFGNQMHLMASRDCAELLQFLRLSCLSLPVELFTDDEALMRIGDQFSQLAELVFNQETLDRHAALVQRVTPLDPQA
ncbi:type III secretion protein W [Pseudomonas sp. LAMO17WK12:I10]|uniref:type III secretion system gatekeeper subunit SctW n=1 Tax=unclassified Pseudomonas TaxID=196821 RepID=UPI000BD31830|nr:MULTISPECIES: type III secretion system gatekeeper subunit SctW [unclassified Pseudomonas]PXX53980.1 type III secretion protein W [Pseudomonas sp. LAMO17WK12:I9]SNY51869.1 type III secretion protein W [Pseudomonas sp. LAMO17WK12:I10]